MSLEDGICRNRGYNIAKILIISNKFSDDFISECEYDHELNLSLITSRGLARILEGFKSSHLTEFPVRLLPKGGLLMGIE
jgi:hypothetical protein